MRIPIISSVLILSAVVFLSAFTCGCSGSKSYHYDLGLTPLEKNWGRAYHEAKYSQIIKPSDEPSTKPVEEMDGAASEANIQEYRNSFRGPSAPTEYNINLGDISSIGQSN
jgi:hypothetical protein